MGQDKIYGWSAHGLFTDRWLNWSCAFLLHAHVIQDPDIQRILNNLQRSRLSCGSMIRLLAHPLLPSPVSKWSLFCSIFLHKLVVAPENVVRSLLEIFLCSSRYLVHLKQQRKLADETAYHFGSTNTTLDHPLFKLDNTFNTNSKCVFRWHPCFLLFPGVHTVHICKCPYLYEMPLQFILTN